MSLHNVSALFSPRLKYSEEKSKTAFKGLNMIQKLIREHNVFRSHTLNLIPSENIVSDAVKEALARELGSRYSSRPEF